MPTCEGRPATIVGSSGAVVAGTQHADVIVTNGARQVAASGGADLICVTPGPPARVAAGKGDDIVDTRAATAATDVDLGPGRDVFRGGPAADRVNAADGTPDTVSTGAGADWVTTGSTAPFTMPGPQQLAPGPPDHDTIDLGPGDDAVVEYEASMSEVDGGPGADDLDVVYGGRADPILDNVHHVLRNHGTTALTWRSIDRFQLETSSRSFSFRGSDRPESVDLSFLDGPGRIDTAGGDDMVTVSFAMPTGVHLDLGGGHDTLRGDNYQHFPGRAVLDLGRQRLRITGGRDTTSTVSGAEAVALRNWDRVDFTGTDRDDDFRTVGACRVTAEGRGGDDLLSTPYLRGPSCPGSVLRGGPGDDRLLGAAGDDTLVGGAGTDYANGFAGTDTCYAETAYSCELPHP